MRLAGSVVPLLLNTTAEPIRISRLLLSEVARKLHELGSPGIEDLFRWCVLASAKDLSTFLSGTPAASLFIGPYEASKAVTRARLALSDTLDPLMSMPGGNFSIRDWMDNGSGNLFITWREDRKHAMKPLISTWVDIFCWSRLAAPHDQEHRWWLVLQDIAILEKIASFESLLAKGRKRSVRAVVGLSSISQLRDAYGTRMLQSILGSLGSRVVMQGSDPETAEYMSKALGTQEVGWMDISPGGKFLARTAIPAVLPSKIRALETLTGYIAFAGNRSISKFALKPVEFVNRQPGFVKTNGTDENTTIPHELPAACTISPQATAQWPPAPRIPMHLPKD